MNGLEVNECANTETIGDLAHVFLQIPLDEQSTKYTWINTHKDLFQYNRLQFGLFAGPAISQRTVESILQGLPRICVYLDDMLVIGVSKEHLDNLRVFDLLEQADFRLKRQKYAFLFHP